MEKTSETKVLIALGLVVIVLLLWYFTRPIKIECTPNNGFACQNLILDANLFNVTLSQKTSVNWTNSYFLWVPEGQSSPFSPLNVSFCPPPGSNAIDDGISCADTSGEVVFLGDSITAGEDWNTLFGAPYIINAGIGGDTTNGVISRLSTVTISRPRKIFLMVGINDLPLRLHENISYILTNYETILRQIRSESPDTVVYIESVLPVNTLFTLGYAIYDESVQVPNSTEVSTIENVLQVYIINLTTRSSDAFAANVSGQIITLNDKLKALANGDKIIFIDLYPAFCGPDNQLYTEDTVNGLHLSPNGYAIWKDLIEQYAISASQAVTFTFNTSVPAGSMHVGTIWAEQQHTTGGPWYLVRVATVTLRAG
jgi:lysophospholipase L1-like esterase